MTVASSFAYAEEDATTYESNTTSLVLELWTLNIDVVYVTSIFFVYDFNIAYAMLKFLPVVRDTEAEELGKLEVVPTLSLVLRTYRVIETKVCVDLG